MKRLGALGIAVVVGASMLGTLAVAQEKGPGRMGPGGQKMPANRQEQMRQRMEEMRAHEARLEQLTKAMNETSGPGKVDAIAAVVNELVSQHQMMHQNRGRMRPGMGGPGHGKMGGPGGGAAETDENP